MIQNLKLLFLLGILTSIFLVVGYSLNGQAGLIISLVLATGIQGISFWNSDKIALAMNGAKPITESEAPELYRITRELCKRAILPIPNLYITGETSPNAFATGRDPDHSAIAVTSGLLQALSKDELEGVIAHELGHIKNRDVFISTIASILASAISTLVQFSYFFSGGRDREDRSNPIPLILSIILSPIAAMLIQMMISRTREYQADASAIEMTGNPSGLANALTKIEAIAKGAHNEENSLQPAFASLYIINPFAGDFLSNLFSTHPPIGKRVEKIMRIGL